MTLTVTIQWGGDWGHRIIYYLRWGCPAAPSGSGPLSYPGMERFVMSLFIWGDIGKSHPMLFHCYNLQYALTRNCGAAPSYPAPTDNLNSGRPWLCGWQEFPPNLGGVTFHGKLGVDGESKGSPWCELQSVASRSLHQDVRSSCMHSRWIRWL